MALPDRIARTQAGLRGRWRLRRQLARITRGLAKDATLAAKFAMFNALTKGEPASGAEPLPRLPRFGWPLTLLAARRGSAGKRTAWRGRAVAVLAMVGVLVAGLLFSLAMRPAARTCLMLASAGTRAAASAAPSKAGQPAAASAPVQSVGGFARGPASTCPAYPAKK
jgi:hypothetical protein